MKNQGNGNGQDRATMRVYFTDANAKNVAIAGTFNDWRPEATKMISLGGGRWAKELVLPTGKYEYLIVADGQWRPDPLAKEQVPNPYGGVNSVMIAQPKVEVADPKKR